MATVYYLDWTDAESAEDSDEVRFLLKMNLSNGEGVESVPRAWYRESGDVPIDNANDAFTALQGDVPLKDIANVTPAMREARRAFPTNRVRNMCAGDILEVEGTLHLVCGKGTKQVEWGDAPSLSLGSVGAP
jgi:hypothetical protein